MSAVVEVRAYSRTSAMTSDEIEIGIGIHGEPGRHRRPMATAREIAEMLVDPVLTDLPYGRGDTVIAFVNGMGGTPLLELTLLYDAARRALAPSGVEIARPLVGNYVTSLDMAGASVTLTLLDDEMTGYWDAPVHTAGLRWGR